MIVRVSARGQANCSADGYLCAREQLEQAEGPRCAMRTEPSDVRVGTTCYQVLMSDIDERFARDFHRARTENCMPSGASCGARSHVHGCRGTRLPWNENHVRLVLYAPGGWAVSLGLRWGQNIIIHDETTNI
jgi:hypothetical protein